MSANLVDGRWFRVLTVIDQFTRECLALVADRALNGHRVALELSQVVANRGAPESITVDNVLRQQSRDASGQSSPVACGASGFSNHCRQRRVASVGAYHQRFARRRTPPLTDACAAAGSQLAGE
jgi:putative transposase